MQWIVHFEPADHSWLFHLGEKRNDSLLFSYFVSPCSTTNYSKNLPSSCVTGRARKAKKERDKKVGRVSFKLALLSNKKNTAISVQISRRKNCPFQNTFIMQRKNYRSFFKNKENNDSAKYYFLRKLKFSKYLKVTLIF